MHINKNKVNIRLADLVKFKNKYSLIITRVIIRARIFIQMYILLQLSYNNFD